MQVNPIFSHLPHLAHKHPICTIIPPHITEKIRQAESDPIIQEQLADVLREEEFLRERRANLFVGAMSLPNRLKPIDDQVRIFDAENRTFLPGVQIIAPEHTADLAAGEAYTWAKKTDEFYRGIFNRNSLDNEGMEIQCTVHYGKNFNNAFWNGEQMVYGDGDMRYFTRFTSDCDVAAHEMTHGVTEYDIDLQYQEQSGALNESLSDVFGIMVKQYVQNKTVEESNWLIGENILKDFIDKPYAMRSMMNPGSAYKNHPVIGNDPQPGSMDAFVHTRHDNGGVHINSGIPNRAFHLACKKLYQIDRQKYAYSWKSAGPAWYGARLMLNPKSSFDEMAYATVAVAESYFGVQSHEAKAIAYAWSEVKVEPMSAHHRRSCSLV